MQTPQRALYRSAGGETPDQFTNSNKLTKGGKLSIYDILKHKQKLKEQL